MNPETGEHKLGWRDNKEFELKFYFIMQYLKIRQGDLWCLKMSSQNLEHFREKVVWYFGLADIKNKLNKKKKKKTKYSVKSSAKKSITSITAKAERKIADNSFLYREFSITAIPFTICIIACATCLANFNKILESFRNGFLRLLESELSFSIRFSLPNWFPSTALCTKSGAKIAGAIRIRAATRSGASK